MIAGCLRLGKSLDGYVERGLIETRKLVSRHNQLATEMIRRGMNHRSPIEVTEPTDLGKVDEIKSMIELISRCEECFEILFSGGYP